LRFSCFALGLRLSRAVLLLRTRSAAIARGSPASHSVRAIALRFSCFALGPRLSHCGSPASHSVRGYRTAAIALRLSCFALGPRCRAAALLLPLAPRVAQIDEKLIPCL